ncbi:hypothetical protein BD289DRAFT_143734 [Coniella lustricola]|uniref:Uncharacterized protein n=1 Tax=Coniella lustricola TaxID=2025994 RepID=A0A2T3AEX1_9PEZI|nr:hypothetical protein BD289DRAFT_143734 [Coniella lustricola]
MCVRLGNLGKSRRIYIITSCSTTHTHTRSFVCLFSLWAAGLLSHHGLLAPFNARLSLHVFCFHASMHACLPCCLGSSGLGNLTSLFFFFFFFPFFFSFLFSLLQIHWQVPFQASLPCPVLFLLLGTQAGQDRTGQGREWS